MQGRGNGPSTREVLLFAAALACLVTGFFHESLLGEKVLSPSDVLFVQASFREVKGPDYEPLNRLLMDPVLQFQPWLAFSRGELRSGRLPLWNPHAGCGTPHLANGQSAVFDPFHAIAYLGDLPGAFAPMAAARLWVAGLGMFLLAGHWGLGRWGRWFAGCVYPFSGFLVCWLLFPVTSVAVWFPWVILAADRVLDRPGHGRVAAMGLVVGFCLLGGHVQTSAHVLLAAGLALLRRWRGLGRGSILAWVGGMALGIGLAAVEVLPLGDYLIKSPVWADRATERKPPWRIVRPRILDVACTALPYAFGSQRRGHPNLARAVGVHNLNESAGGFVGLATLLWLAPLAWSSRRRAPVRWLYGLTAIGLLAGYRWPPADNLLRAIPVLNVTDNRRLTLWVAFGLSLLGGAGLDRLGATRRGGGWGRWALAWVALAGLCAIVAAGSGRFEGRVLALARGHYDRTARETPGADPGVYRARADRQVRDAITFLPRYYGLAAAHLAGLAGWAFLIRTRRLRAPTVLRGGLFTLTLVDLFGFGVGLNPSIDRQDYLPVTPVVEHLRRVASMPARVLGVGEEWPPNVAMRYGLADIRNYDSVELSIAVERFASLYPPGGGERTSRREVTWDGVLRSRAILREAGVRAIVGSTPPPPDAFAVVDRIGSAWIALPDASPYAVTPDGSAVAADRSTPGVVRMGTASDESKKDKLDVIFHESNDGWWEGLATTDRDGWSVAEAGPRPQARAFRYAPKVFVFAGFATFFCGAWVVFALTRFGLMPSTRIVLKRLGRSPAAGLESELFHAPRPDDPTGENSRKRR